MLATTLFATLLSTPAPADVIWTGMERPTRLPGLILAGGGAVGCAAVELSRLREQNPLTRRDRDSFDE
jgi:hypothetical protein